MSPPAAGDPPWHRVEELFDELADLPAGERARRLAEHPDPRLAAEARSLLAAEAHAAELVDGTVAEAGIRWSEGEEMPPALGVYRPLRELGRGGFGVVYLAERVDDEFRMEVAVKLLHRRGSLPGAGHRTALHDLERRLLRERQILANLKHPNIARLLDVGTAADGRPFLVMEYVDGEPIDRWCDSRGLDVRARVKLLLAVCQAVAHAHRALVVHRDLKPSNILVDAEGTPKLLDFGIAKLLRSDDGVPLPDATRTGRLALTPEYASPEQIRGRALTTASDVYSLGVLLYRLLTGAAPYSLEVRSASELEEVICEHSPPPPSAAALDRHGPEGPGRDTPDPARQRGTTPRGLARALAGDLDAIAAMALRKEPERRYASVEQLAEDLERFLDGRPVRAQGDSLSYRLGRLVRRHRLAVAAAGLLLASLVVGVISTTVQKLEAERQQARAEQVTRLLVNDVFGAASPNRAQGETVTAREILDRSVGDLDLRLSGSPDLHATLLAAVGRLYQQLGAYARAQVLIQRGLDQLRRVYGEQHPEVLRTQSDLGDVLFDRGLHPAARELLLSAAAVQRRLEGRGRADLATTLHRLALLELALDRLDAAEGYAAEAYELRSEEAGADSPEAAACLAVLAKLEYQRGELEAAEARALQVLEIRRSRMGELHPDVLVSLNDLAVILQARGDFVAAARRLEEVVAANARVHGEGHRNHANALANLAWVLGRLGETDAAIHHLERARAYHLRALGPEHPATHVSLRNLARLLGQGGRHGEAEALLEEHLETLGGLPAPPRMEMARSRVELAKLHLDRGEGARAEALIRLALEGLDPLLPEGDWRRATVELQLGRALCLQGARADAVALLDASARRLESALGVDDPRVRGAREELRRCRAADRIEADSR